MVSSNASFRQLPKPHSFHAFFLFCFVLLIRQHVLSSILLGIELVPPAMEAGSLNHWTTKKSHEFFFNNSKKLQGRLFYDLTVSKYYFNNFL